MSHLEGVSVIRGAVVAMSSWLEEYKSMYFVLLDCK